VQTKLFGNRQAKGGRGVSTGHHPCALQLGVDALNVGTANRAGSYQANFQFRHGKFSFFIYFCLICFEREEYESL
jgi:hypothetical protein